jgi:hypothetical protein
MSENLVLSERGLSGIAVVAFVVGLGSIAALSSFLPATLPLGAVAIVLGLVSRRALRRDDALRGSRLSLAGFLLGIAGAVLGGAVPLTLILVARVVGFAD